MGGKSTTWRPRGGQWKKRVTDERNKERQAEEAAARGVVGGADSSNAASDAQQQNNNNNNKKGIPFPKHCRGLVHVALCVSYTGVPFRGLQIQTQEHISHTVEGQLLLAIKKAGYLLDEDFTEDGSKLRAEGGIRITSSISSKAEEEVVNADDEGADGKKMEMKDGATTEEKVVGGDQEPPQQQKEGQPLSTPPPPAHVHKHIVPQHLHAHMSKRQRKKYDPNFNSDGRFHFARSCRTDKGVHAVRNVVSLYLREEDWRRDGNDGMMAKINACIPIVDEDENDNDNHSERTKDGEKTKKKKIMQVLAVTPVLPSFNPKDCCNSRVYRYLIPLYALGLPPTTSTSTSTASKADCDIKDPSSFVIDPSQFKSVEEVNAYFDAINSTYGGNTNASKGLVSADGDNASPAATNLPPSLPIPPASYFNGSAIDDWESLFRHYPAFLEKGRALAAKKNKMTSPSPSSPPSFSSFSYATTWLPKPSSLLRGHAALIAKAAEIKEEEEEEEEEKEAVRCDEEEEDDARDECFDHPILRQLVEFSNDLLYTRYIGSTSKRFHNFSATAIDGEALGHRNSMAAKQLSGDDPEASRNIRRCELSPSIVWLPAPSAETKKDDNDDNDGSSNNSIESGTIDFLVGGDYGLRDLKPDGGEEDPVAALYDLKRQQWLKRNVAGSASSSPSSPPLLLPFVVFQVDGQSFLLNMIRKLVGFLLAVVRGGRPWWIRDLITARVMHRVVAEEEEEKTDGKAEENRLEKEEVSENEQQQRPRASKMVPSLPFSIETAFEAYNKLKNATTGVPPSYPTSLIVTTSSPNPSALVFASKKTTDGNSTTVAGPNDTPSASTAASALPPPPAAPAAPPSGLLFNGYCKPSLLTDAFEPMLQVQTPLAPGPYLSLLQSKYTAYDMGVRAMERRREKVRRHEEKMKAKARMAEEQAKTTTTNTNEGEENDNATAAVVAVQNSANEAEKGAEDAPAASSSSLSAPSFTPYYVTDVFPLSDAWSSNPPRRTDAENKANNEKPDAVLLGRKRGRDAEEVEDGDENEEGASVHSASSVEALAEAFYWSVIAKDIVALDCGLFLTDIDASLGLRDGRRWAREEEKRKIKTIAEEATALQNESSAADANATSQTQTPATITPPPPPPPPTIEQQTEALFQKLSRPPFVTPESAANPKFSARLRAQIALTVSSAAASTSSFSSVSGGGEMTPFLRSLRMHNWMVRIDEKVRHRLTTQHEQSVKHWHDRMRARQAAVMAAASVAAADTAHSVDCAAEGTMNDGKLASFSETGDTTTTTAAAMSTAVTAATTAFSTPPYVSKAEVRRHRHHDRHVADLAAVARMLNTQEVQQMAKTHNDNNKKIVVDSGDVDDTERAADGKRRRTEGAARSSHKADDGDDDDDDDDMSRNSDGEEGDDDALLVSAPATEGNTNRNNNRNNSNGKGRSTTGGDDEEGGDLSELLSMGGLDYNNCTTFETRADDGWWYHGASAVRRAAHRLLYKQAMVALVKDRQACDAAIGFGNSKREEK